MTLQDDRVGDQPVGADALEDLQQGARPDLTVVIIIRLLAEGTMVREIPVVPDAIAALCPLADAIQKRRTVRIEEAGQSPVIREAFVDRSGLARLHNRTRDFEAAVGSKGQHRVTVFVGDDRAVFRGVHISFPSESDVSARASRAITEPAPGLPAVVDRCDVHLYHWDRDALILGEISSNSIDVTVDH